MRDNHVFIRAWLYLSRDVQQHAYLLRAGAPHPQRRQGQWYGLHTGAGTWFIMANIVPGSPHGGYRPGRDRMISGRWVCIEVEFDADEGHMKFWLDGANEPTRVANNWRPFDIEWIDFGMGHFQSDNSVDVFWDDIAIGTDGRIGCD